MAQYISKSALVAAIKERLKYNGTKVVLDGSAFMAGRVKEDEDILTLLDTLEVKGVDLEKENLPISNSLTKEGLFTFEDGSQAVIKKLNTGGSSE